MDWLIFVCLLTFQITLSWLKIIKKKIVLQREEPGQEMYDSNGVRLQKLGTDPNYRHQLVPGIILIFVILHLGAVYGFYLGFRTTILTSLWGELFLNDIENESYRHFCSRNHRVL